VKLRGKYFDVKVENGAKIHKGDLIMQADLNGIQNSGYPTVTPVIVTNTDDFSSVHPSEKSNCRIGDKIIEIK
jgi:PTS system D-glucosamine-specific IIC component